MTPLFFGNKGAEAPKIGKGIVWIKTEAQCNQNCMIGQSHFDSKGKNENLKIGCFFRNNLGLVSLKYIGDREEIFLFPYKMLKHSCVGT